MSEAAQQAPEADGETGADGLPVNDEPMTVMEHLRELRKRLVLGVIGLIPGAVLGWTYKEPLLNAFLKPYSEAFERLGLGTPAIHFANPISPLMAYFKLSIIAGLMVGMPWIAWQVWRFIAPGLYPSERRYAIPFSFASTLFFCGGAWFGFEIVFPMAFDMLLGMSGDIGGVTIQPTIMIDEYLAFATRMLLAFGTVFEIPVVVTLISAAGLVNWQQLLDFGRWWIVVAAVLSALLTPPDISSQLLMIIPLVVLYFLSVGVAYFVGPAVEPKGDDAA